MSLKLILKEFTDICKNKISEMINNGESFKIKYKDLAPHISIFYYNKGTLRYNIKPVEIKKEELNFMKCYNFITEFCKKHPKFNELYKCIINNYDLNDIFINRLIDNFILTFINNIHNGLIEDIIKEKIEIFINDLNLSPTKWNAKIWVDGIWLEDDSLQLNKNIKIRKINHNDIEFVKKQGLYTGFESKEAFISTTAIIEYNCKKETQSKIGNGGRIMYHSKIIDECEIIILTFRLFRLGSIFFNKCEMRASSVLFGNPIQLMPKILIKNRFKYGLLVKDIPKTMKIYELINTPTLRRIILDKSEKLHVIKIALERYENAFLNSENSQSIISYVSSSLEALFLGRYEDGTITRRLTQRISVIFKIFGFDPFLISEIVKKVYSIRSNYTHGSNVRLKDLGLESFDCLVKMALECNRISILIYLQLNSKINKVNLLNLIDKALLDDDSYRKLETLLKNNCKVI